MAAMMQNYLMSQFAPRLFMSDAHISETLVSLFPEYAKHWHNQRNPTDVNNDGYLTAVDALDGITEINGNGARRLALLPALPVHRYYDVSGNGVLSALDVLLVINAINRDAAMGGEASPVLAPAPEGEAAPAVAEAFRLTRDVIAAAHLTSFAEPSPAVSLAADQDADALPAAFVPSKNVAWAAHDAVYSSGGVSRWEMPFGDWWDLLPARDASAGPLSHPWARMPHVLREGLL
jgi:hypothetical protein